MPYSSYDHDKLETAETMRIERRIYFEAKDGEIAPYVSLPLEQLHAMREESAAAEQAIFNDLARRAAAWEEQAGKTLLLDKAIEYTRTTVVQHTSNEWQKGEYDRYTRSNRVYQMNYHIYENTRYDKEAATRIPHGASTNSPTEPQAKIAGQDRKVFTDKAAMEKYLNGRIKAYDRLFTEISPPIPQEYADYFKVNGMLMPDYTIEGEEPPQQQPQATAIPENTEVVLLLPLAGQITAMQSVGITADNPQDFSIRGYSDARRNILPCLMMVCAASVANSFSCGAD